MNETDFTQAHITYLRACQEANTAREEVRRLAIGRASAMHAGKPAGMTSLNAAGYKLYEAEQAEAVAYGNLWKIATEEV